MSSKSIIPPVHSLSEDTKCEISKELLDTLVAHKTHLSLPDNIADNRHDAGAVKVDLYSLLLYTHSVFVLNVSSQRVFCVQS